jgi:uridine phosphorylase
MELHVHGKSEEISRYVFCPGSQDRARRIAGQFENPVTVSEERGIVVYSGFYQGIFMTSCGTGMGGPATAIACEELAHLGADTFIRVGSCGVLQEGQGPGDIIIASGTFRAGGTGNYYLPLAFPAVPTFEVLRELVRAAEHLKTPVRVGLGIAGDSFYTLKDSSDFATVKATGGLFIEMESDTLFIVGQLRGWRTGALFTSDGAPGKVKPDWAEETYLVGEERMRQVALQAMLAIAQKDLGV